MDEMLARQLTRQLSVLNRWIKFFGILFLIGFLVLGILIYKVISFTHNAEKKINNIQQTTSQDLNVQNKLCSSSLVQKETGLCH